ncbi:MAG: D-alanine--D-alanine ligase [Lachnospiraceae bacterium]|nr:D-alanine--D-alanine ligase [Lachnospiraceae bacterium]
MKIVVLAGGTSTEREVSLCSGSNIYGALKRNGHQAVLLDIYLGLEGDVDDVFTRDYDWARAVEKISATCPDMESRKKLRGTESKSFFGPNVLKICEMADLAFIALHGQNGEDGKVQATLELLGVPYTGTDYASSALAMNKSLTKDLFRQNGVMTPESFNLKKGEKEPAAVSFPAVVKVITGGSSVGVYICNSKEEYEEAKKNAFLYEDAVLVEQYIKGREFSVGVIDGKALPAIEIAPLEGFYDYKNKYQAGSTIETCPADISPEAEKKLRAAAEAAFHALRLRAYARMDFIMDEKGDVYCLEANSLPGMTTTSLLPQEAAAAGMDFDALCEKLIEVSLK